MPLILAWFRAFLLTLAIEELAAGWLLRRDVAPLRGGALIAVANVASHPAVWLIFPELGQGLRWPRLVTLLASEAWAVGLEALIYALFLGTGRTKQAVRVSLLANGLSFSIGLGAGALGWI